MKKSIFTLLVAVLFSANLSSCAYRFGSPERRIPGGYHLIAVPVFKNKTQEVAIETYFTNSMIVEVEKSNLAQVTPKEESQAILLGEILSLEIIRGTEVSKKTSTAGSGGLYENLPVNTVLAKDYRIVVKAHVRLVRSSDMAILWEGSVTGENRYPAPVIAKQALNTANPLYNQSAKSQNVQLISQDMMAEVYERLTENF